MNLIFAQPCWQLSCLSGWEEQVFAELELGALALWPKLNPFAACFLILWRRWQAISLVARPLRKRVVVNHPWFELMRPPGWSYPDSVDSDQGLAVVSLRVLMNCCS